MQSVVLSCSDRSGCSFFAAFRFNCGKFVQKLSWSHSIHTYSFFYSYLDTHTMSRSPCRSAHGTFTLIVSILVFLLACSYAPTQASNSKPPFRPVVKPANLSNPCMRKLTPIVLHQSGCEPRRTKIPYCTGVGPSFDRNLVRPPFKERSCSCCASTEHKATRRKLTFVCGGRNETRSVYFQKISSCGLVDCNFLLTN